MVILEDKEIYSLLSNVDAFVKIRNLVVQELKSGTRRNTVINYMMQFLSDLREKDEILSASLGIRIGEEEEEIILVILDHLTGWCNPAYSLRHYK